MKRRTKVVALATSLLVGVSMIGVGFASWVISNSVEGSATGNVTAESVAVADVELEVTPSDGAAIHFGAPAQMENGSAWLTNSNGQTESLKVTFTIKMKGVDHINVQYFIGADTPSVMGQNWNDAIAKKFVTAPKFTEGTVSDGTSGLTFYEVDETTGNIKITDGQHPDMATEYTYAVDVEFKWGEHFNSENPYTYYNSKTATETCTGGYGYSEAINGNTSFDQSKFQDAEAAGSVDYTEDAYASLNMLDHYLTDQKYNFVFTAYSK